MNHLCKEMQGESTTKGLLQIAADVPLLLGTTQHLHFCPEMGKQKRPASAVLESPKIKTHAKEATGIDTQPLKVAGQHLTRQVEQGRLPGYMSYVLKVGWDGVLACLGWTWNCTNATALNRRSREELRLHQLNLCSHLSCSNF